MRRRYSALALPCTALAGMLLSSLASSQQPVSQGYPASPSQLPELVEMSPPDLPSPERPGFVWKITGDRSVRPARISDDGARTYLEWAPDQSLPAVFALSRTGSEEVVNGYMREEIFVIDRIHEKLLFRIDEKRAIAVRKGPSR